MKTNMNILKMFLLSTLVVLFTACGSSKTGDTTVDAAINKFIAYTQSGGTGTAPTLQDYLDAGIIGVTVDNIAEINEIIGNLTEAEVDTKEEVQVLADETGVTVVDPRNTSPIAKAGAIPTTVTEGETVSFSSRHSSDPDGTIVSYKWTEDGVGLANVPSFTKSNFTLGTHAITLTVTDNDGATDTVTITITVAAVAQAQGQTQTCLEAAGYKTITLDNNQTWLDRNLGAATVGEYGSLYQWGRATDGHENRTSNTTSTQATTITPEHGDFITQSEWTTGDTDFTLRATAWSTVNGTNQVCPCGFVVPSNTDRIALQTTNFSALNLPYGGLRNTLAEGSINNETISGWFWTTMPHILFVVISGNPSLLQGNGSTGKGASIRCIDPSSRLPY